MQRLTIKQKIVTLPWIARSPDLAPTALLWDTLGCNVRYDHDVRLRPEMITALRREWAAIPYNDIRTIIGPMRHHCTTCMRADGGRISN